MCLCVCYYYYLFADGRNVVFGKIIDGLDVILKRVDGAFCVNLKPANPISIKDCGRILPDSAEWKAVDARIAAASKAAAAVASKAAAAAAATTAKPATPPAAADSKQKKEKQPTTSPSGAAPASKAAPKA